MAEYIIKINDNDEADSDGGKRVEEMHRLVRCKDCKWGEPARNGKGEEMIFCYCGDTGIEDGWLLDPDWYCAEGERRGDHGPDDLHG